MAEPPKPLPPFRPVIVKSNDPLPTFEPAHGEAPRRRSYKTIGHDLSKCHVPGHVHCRGCGCPLNLAGETKPRNWCVQCIERGDNQEELRLEDFMGAQSTWPWAGE